MKNSKFNVFIFPICIFLCMFSFLFVPSLFPSEGLGVVVLLIPLYFSIPFLFIAQLIKSSLNKINLFYSLCLCLIGVYIPLILFLYDDPYLNLIDYLFDDNKYITIYIIICTIIYITENIYIKLKRKIK